MNPFKWGRGSGIRRFTEAQRNDIRRAYETGLPLNAVARKFKSDRSTIRRAIVDAGGAIRVKGHEGIPS